MRMQFSLHRYYRSSFECINMYTFLFITLSDFAIAISTKFECASNKYEYVRITATTENTKDLRKNFWKTSMKTQQTHTSIELCVVWAYSTRIYSFRCYFVCYSTVYCLSLYCYILHVVQYFIIYGYFIEYCAVHCFSHGLLFCYCCWRLCFLKFPCNQRNGRVYF